VQAGRRAGVGWRQEGRWGGGKGGAAGAGKCRRSGGRQKVVGGGVGRWVVGGGSKKGQGVVAVRQLQVGSAARPIAQTLFP